MAIYLYSTNKLYINPGRREVYPMGRFVTHGGADVEGQMVLGWRRTELEPMGEDDREETEVCQAMVKQRVQRDMGKPLARVTEV